MRLNNVILFSASQDKLKVSQHHKKPFKFYVSHHRVVIHRGNTFSHAQPDSISIVQANVLLPFECLFVRK